MLSKGSQLVVLILVLLFLGACGSSSSGTCEENPDVQVDGDGPDSDDPQLEGPCDGVACGSNATCDNATGDCVCNEGYENWQSGQGCTEIPGPCAGVACGSNATCDNATGDCVCNEGYENWQSGQGCTEIPGPCAGVACGSNATCDNATGDCVCNEGYENWQSGQGCTEIPGPCGGVACYSNATCNNATGDCVCNEGYENWQSGQGCTEVPGPCGGVACYSNATCDNATGDCVCNEGYENWQSGQGCTEVPGPCGGVACYLNATCDNTTGDCVCNEGYENWQSGQGCTEIPGPCGGVACYSNATCDNATGDCVCNEGYENWQSGQGCTEIDLCSGVTCGTNAHCDSTFVQCVCDFGFMGDPSVACTEGCADDRLEDDDTSATANVVTLPYFQSGLSAIASAGEADDDWFAVELQENQTVLFGVFFSHALGDIDVLVYDHPALNDSEDYLGGLWSETDNEIGYFVAPAAGTYYLRIVPYDETMCNIYTVSAETIPNICVEANPCDGENEQCYLTPGAGDGYTCECLEGYRRDPDSGVCYEWCPEDMYEPNDAFDQAAPIETPFQAEGLTRLTDNNDWYSFEAVEGSLILIQAAFDRTAGDIDLYLYDAANPNAIPAYSAGSTNEESIAYTVPSGTSGTYNLEVRLYDDNFGMGDYCNSYDLSVIVTDGNPCAGQCSGEYQQCEVIHTEPYYECRCGTGYIWNEAGNGCVDNPCSPNPCQANAVCTVAWDEPDLTSCACADGYLDDGSGACILICEEDTLSPNHTAFQAVAVASLPWSNTELAAVNPGSTHLTGNHDWFTFTLNPGEVVLVEASFRSADGDIDLHLFDYPANHQAYDAVASSAFSGEDNESFYFASQSGGTYYLRVRPYTPGMCNLYDLSIRLVQNMCLSNPCTGANRVCVPYPGYSPGYYCECAAGYQHDAEHDSCVLYCADDTLENNDSRTGATEITTPFQASSLVAMNSTTYNADDDDWFVMALSVGEWVQVDTTFDNSFGDIDLYLYDQTDTSNSVKESRHWGNSERIVYQAPSSGDYYLRVSPADTTPQCTPYNLSIVKLTDPCLANPCTDPLSVCVFHPGEEPDYTCDCQEGLVPHPLTGLCYDFCPDDAFEPNDTLVEPWLVETFPFEPTGLNTTWGDDDLFTFQAEEGSVIFVESDFQEDVGTVRFHLYDGDDPSLVVATTVTAPDERTFRYQVPSGHGGTYLLRVTSVTFGVCQEYDLRLVVTEGDPCLNACGENQDCEPVSTEPYFQCSCSAGMIWNEAGDACVPDPCAPVTCRANAHCVVDWTEPSLYTCPCNNNYVENEFDECVMHCPDDGYSPNHDSASAHAIDVLPFLAEDLVVYKDAATPHDDWFSLSLQAGDRVEIEVSYSYANGDIDLVLYTSTMGYIDIAVGSSDVERIVHQADTAQGYLLWVRSYTDGMCNSYDLSVRILPDPCAETPCTGEHEQCQRDAVLHDQYECVCAHGYVRDADSGVCVELCPPDGYEQDDTSTDASEITMPFDDTGLTIFEGDDDWFFFDVPENHLVRATALFDHDDGDINVALFAASNTTTPVARAEGTQDNETLSYPVAVGEGGTYYLRVQSLDYTCQTYALSIELVENPCPEGNICLTLENGSGTCTPIADWEDFRCGCVPGHLWNEATDTCDVDPIPVLCSDPEPNVSIPDAIGEYVSDSLTVGEGTTLSTVCVSVTISHTYINDLIVRVTSPEATTYTLHNRTGEDADNIHESYSVEAFTGQSPIGTWTLSAADFAGTDTGSIDAWCLRLGPCLD